MTETPLPLMKATKDKSVESIWKVKGEIKETQDKGKEQKLNTS